MGADRAVAAADFAFTLAFPGAVAAESAAETDAPRRRDGRHWRFWRRRRGRSSPLAAMAVLAVGVAAGVAAPEVSGAGVAAPAERPVSAAGPAAATQSLGAAAGSARAAIFVQQGGVLRSTEARFLAAARPGAGAAGGKELEAASQGLGSGIFLQGSGTLTFAPGSAQTETIADVITDQTASGGTGGNTGSWGLLLDGAGTLTLAAADSYSGGTTIEGGALQLGYGSSDGSIAGNVNDHGTFVDDNSGSHALAGNIFRVGLISANRRRHGGFRRR